MTEIKNNLPVIQVKGISKSFSGIYALKDIDIDIYAGKVNAIVGENGAGKSTLMKILSG
ncbi:MAG: ABC-type sugar transport system ATPase subunit, partial [Gammaproteobacteria bacterium]